LAANGVTHFALVS